MNIPHWLLKHLPLFEYICPKCRKNVKQNSHECPHCGEKYPLTLKVPPTFLKDPKKLELYVHKHVFPRISEFERNYLTQYFTTLFTSGWENSGGIDVLDGGAWTAEGVTAGGLNSVVLAPVHSGTYAYQASPSGLDQSFAQVSKTLLGTANPLYLRFYININIINTNGLTLLARVCSGGNEFLGDSSRDICSVTIQGVGTDLYLHNNLGGYSCGVALVQGVWNCIEIGEYWGVNGWQKLWLNGILVNSQTLDNSGFWSASDGVILGLFHINSNDAVLYAVYDDVVVADTRIYCGVPAPRGTIAIHAKLAGII